MTTSRPEHEKSQASPAPGDLELVRGFLSLHDHEPGRPESLPPSPATLERWFREEGSLPEGEEASGADLAWATSIFTALQTRVEENMGTPRDHDAAEVLNSAARETGLRVCFGCEDPFHTSAEAIRGAVGRMLGIAFLAELDGSWERMRRCSDPTCTSVFFDHSKNRSAKWCSMRTCGNRNKVRSFRERQAAEA